MRMRLSETKGKVTVGSEVGQRAKNNSSENYKDIESDSSMTIEEARNFWDELFAEIPH